MTKLIMDIRSMLTTSAPSRGSHSLDSSSGSSASAHQPSDKTTFASTANIEFHSATAMTERPALHLDSTAKRTLPWEGFDDMYDDSRHPSPEAKAGPGKEISDLPPVQESSVRGEPLIFSANSQLAATKPAVPTPGASVQESPINAFAGAWYSALPLPESNIHETTSTNFRVEPQSPTPWPRTISPVAFRRLETVAISSNRIHNDATEDRTAQPDPVTRNSSRTPADARMVDADAWEAQRQVQGTHQPSDLSPQASSRTLSGSQETAIDFSASNLNSRNVSDGPSGPRTGSNAKYENGNPVDGTNLDEWLYTSIEAAIQGKFDVQLGAALLCKFANDCHKSDEIRKGKQRESDAPLSPRIPFVEDSSTFETESSDKEAAILEYINNVKRQLLTSNGMTIMAHPDNAVWQLLQNRLASARRWETACHTCPTIIDSRRAQYCQSCTEQRERTISPSEAAVDDNRNETGGAALTLTSGHAASSIKVTGQANGNASSNANETQTRPSTSPFPSGCSSRRTLHSSAAESVVPASESAPTASESHVSHREWILGRISTPDQVQAFENDRTEDANNMNEERRRRVARNRARRRQQLSDSSNGSNEVGPSERSHRVAASGTSVAGWGTSFGAGISCSGTNLTASDLAVTHAPDPVTSPTSPATPLTRGGPSGTRVRLTLRVPAEADPEHPDHEAHLRRMDKRRMRIEMNRMRRRGRE